MQFDRSKLSRDRARGKPHGGVVCRARQVIRPSRVSQAYVAQAAANSVAVIDLATQTVQRTLATGTGPDGIAFLAR